MLRSFLAVSVSLLASVQSQGLGDPEALTGSTFNKPTQSFTPFQGPKPTYALNDLPDQYFGNNGGGREDSQDQFGFNRCAKNAWNQESKCQTAWVNSLEDFCVWGPPNGGTIGDTEREAVAYCTTDRHGTRLIPDGTITGAHFVITKDYAQITGSGDFTSIGIPLGDAGGEMDSHGADDLSNPIGGVVYTTANPATNGKAYPVREWTNFMSQTQFCFRVCWGDQDRAQCQHVYDILGCNWNIPANYQPGFESCEGDVAEIQGVYGGSTFYQGQPVTPEAHPAPSSSQCSTTSSIGHGLLAVSGGSTIVGSLATASSSSSVSASGLSTSAKSSTTGRPTNDTSANTDAASQTSSASGIYPKLLKVSILTLGSFLLGYCLL